MKYTGAAAFRQALTQHITMVTREQGLSHTRIRKLIVFDRFLARLLAASPEGWVLKGGVALNLRWQRQARTTKDLDLGRLDDEETATEHLLAATNIDLDDFFMFAVERTAKLDTMRDGATVRYHVTAELAGRRFDEVTVDIGFGDPLDPAPDTVPGTTLLMFAGIERLAIPTIALEQHLAEKVHAYTRFYDSGKSTRAKDLVDLVLAEQIDTPHAGRFMAALDSIFNARATHSIPETLPRPPALWAIAYGRLAAEVGLPTEGGGEPVDDAHARASSFLQAILDGTAPTDAVWDPATRVWRQTAS
jgi:Nucleotidyl transferase AbiEii toxin, Type IV TA system